MPPSVDNGVKLLSKDNSLHSDLSANQDEQPETLADPAPLAEPIPGRSDREQELGTGP